MIYKQCFSLFKYFEMSDSRNITKLKFSNLKNNKSLDSIFLLKFKCILHYLSVPFPFPFLKFPKIMQRDVISWRETLLYNGWIIYPALLYFRFKSLKVANSTSFFSFKCNLQFSSAFLSFSKFPQINEGGPSFFGGTNSTKRLNCLLIRSAIQF